MKTASMPVSNAVQLQSSKAMNDCNWWLRDFSLFDAGFAGTAGEDGLVYNDYVWQHDESHPHYAPAPAAVI